MRPTLFRIFAALFILAAIAAGRPALAADFYDGKTITVVVPTSPGGTYDTMARLLAKHMPNHIPGKPQAVVQNRPGGAYLIGARPVYTAEPDGTMLFHFPTTAAFNQLLGKGGDVDFNKFEWIGSAGGARYVIAVPSSLGIKTVDDLKNAKDPVKIGVLGPGSPIVATAKMAKQMAGFNLQLVPGYKGMANILLAYRQGEVDAVSTGATVFLLNSTANEVYTSKDITLVTDLGGAVAPGPMADEVNSLPKMKDAIADATDRRVFTDYMETFRVTRPIVTTPGTPKERVALLRKAFDDTFKDPAFVEEVEKAGFPIAPTSGTDAEKLIHALFAMEDDVKSKLTSYLK